MTPRAEILARLADRLCGRPAQPVRRVAVDGVDGAGKTTFADELAVTLGQRGRRVLRASADGFHHPRDVRYRRGRSSFEGFYRDSYDLAAMRRELLDPLGPGGSLLYRTATFDVQRDEPVWPPYQQARPGDLLIVDGLFLHRPELQPIWDDSVFLAVPIEVSVPRGAARGPGYGSPDPLVESNQRYIEGQRLYFHEATPERHAGVVIDHTDLMCPVVLHWRER
ncbi:uridine kinase [Deinococcus navajonensis]|uniref:Uridine kinase n=1 Tax=Deinococcus navajonensis TaxID=309884 RepID=A0ABV8XL70_9DEIO